MEVAFQAREVVDLQPLDLLFDSLACREQRRHRDERAQMRGNTIAKFQSGQKRRAEAPRHAAVHQRDRRVDGGDRTQSAEQAQPCPAEPRRSQGEQR